MRNPQNVYGTGSADDPVAASLGVFGSDYIDDTQTHIAGEAPDSGAGPNEVYYPEVTFWIAVKNVSGGPTFDSGSELAGNTGGDDPQAGEPVGGGWTEGPLKKIQLEGGTVRAVRGK